MKMVPGIVFAILLCATFWFFVPGAILVIGSWPAFQIFGLIAATLSFVCWRWCKRSCVADGTSDRLLVQTITFSALLGFIAVAAISIPQAARRLNDSSVEASHKKLRSCEEILCRLEKRGEDAIGSVDQVSPQSLSAEDLKQRIAIQKNRFASMAPADSNFGEFKQDLYWCELWYGDYVGAASQRIACWFAIISSALLVFFWLIASVRVYPRYKQSLTGISV